MLKLIGQAHLQYSEMQRMMASESPSFIPTMMSCSTSRGVQLISWAATHRRRLLPADNSSAQAGTGFNSVHLDLQPLLGLGGAVQPSMVGSQTAAVPASVPAFPQTAVKPYTAH